MGLKKVVHALGMVLLLAAIFFGWQNQISRLDPEFLSPYDEQTHFDYWWRIYEKKELPEVFDRMHYEPMNIWSCHGEGKANKPECSSSQAGPSTSENTSSNYLPTFYAATAGMAWVLEPFVESNDLFHLAKLANLAWGLISVVLVAWLLLLLAVPPMLAAVVVFGVSQTPAFVFAGITFTQEMFVLFFCLTGLIWHVKRTAHAGIWRFALETGVLAGICLTIKPTALLLPVIIAVSEMLAVSRPWPERLRRVLGFSAVVMGFYLCIHLGLNQWRGVNPSDGKLRDFLAGLDGGRSHWQDWAGYVWTSFTRSVGSLHWRQMVDWDLPFVFMWFHQLVMAMLVMAVPYFLVCAKRRAAPFLSSRLFLGSVAAFVVLPLALAIYLLLIDFPYFFQPRYYTAYIVVSVILASAFLVDLGRLLWGSLGGKLFFQPAKGQL